ncbi:MAG: Ig-like domain-containing protein [Ferrimonas sp.]
MSRYLSKLLALILLPITIILSGCNSDGVFSNKDEEETLPPNEAVITHIVVTPPFVNVALEQKAQLTVTAYYSDSSSSNITQNVEWHSNNPEITSIDDNGLLTGMTSGEAVLIAMLNELESNEVNVNVTDASLVSLELTADVASIALSQRAQLKVIASYSDRSSFDVTEYVTWHSSAMNIAPVDAQGQILGTDVGTTTITAALASVDGSAINGVVSNSLEMAVTNAFVTAVEITSTNDIAFFPVGYERNILATAYYNNGTSADVTSEADWHSSDEAVLAFAYPNTGRVKAFGTGAAAIHATYMDITSDEITFNISEMIIQQITVFSNTNGGDVEVDTSGMKLPIGRTAEFMAQAYYSDGTRYDLSSGISWLSNAAIATVSPEGLLTAVEVGHTAVMGSIHHNGVHYTSAPYSVEVTPLRLDYMTLFPDDLSMNVSEPVNLANRVTISVYYTNGTNENTDSNSNLYDDITWQVVDPTIATVTENGIVEGLTTGNTSVMISYQDVQAELFITVN